MFHAMRGQVGLQVPYTVSKKSGKDAELFFAEWSVYFFKFIFVSINSLTGRVE